MPRILHNGLVMSNVLFNGNSILDILPAQEEALKKAVDDYDGNRLLNTSVEDITAYFSDKFRLDVPVLDESGIETDQEEVEIDVSQDPRRTFFHGSGPFYVSGTRIVLIIPFEGESVFFGVRPQSYSLNPPRGETSNSQLRIYFECPHDQMDEQSVKQALTGQLEAIKSSLAELRQSAEAYNAQLPEKARNIVEARRKRLLDALGVSASLGFPMRRRDGGRPSYSPPEIRRKLVPKSPPSASSGAFRPEPSLPDTEYDYILRLIASSMEVLERSPKAYSKMGEEDLRTQVLVMLNSHYEGHATGETFNYAGKTDIYVKSGGGNVFVAECKFWDGPRKLAETIDQLLGYVTWRDTKTAIVIFNRNKGFVEMKKSLDGSVAGHEHFKRVVSSDQRQIRCILSHPDDKNREIVVTILCFDVPTEAGR